MLVYLNPLSASSLTYFLPSFTTRLPLTMTSTYKEHVLSTFSRVTIVSSDNVNFDVPGRVLCPCR